MYCILSGIYTGSSTTFTAQLSILRDGDSCSSPLITIPVLFFFRLFGWRNDLHLLELGVLVKLHFVIVSKGCQQFCPRTLVKLIV